MRRTNSCVRFRIWGEIWIQLQVSHIYLATWIATEVKTGAVIKSFPIKNASMTLLSLWSYVILCGYLKQFSKNKYIAIWLVVLKTIYINRRIRPFTLLYILFPSSRSPHSCFSIAKYAVIGQKPFRRPSRFSPFFHNLSEWGHIDFFNKPLETV